MLPSLSRPLYDEIISEDAGDFFSSQSEISPCPSPSSTPHADPNVRPPPGTSLVPGRQFPRVEESNMETPFRHQDHSPSSPPLQELIIFWKFLRLDNGSRARLHPPDRKGHSPLISTLVGSSVPPQQTSGRPRLSRIIRIFTVSKRNTFRWLPPSCFKAAFLSLL